MKCPVCNGKGYFPISDIAAKVCPQCNGTGEVEQTNEEWMKQCTTEQLAEWIAEQKCDGCNDEPYNEKHSTCKYCMTKKTEQIRAWLKQPHQEKE